MKTRVPVPVMMTAALVAVGTLTLPGPADAAQGRGNPTLQVTPATLVDGRPRTVTVSGHDYLVPPHAPGIDVFGGAYLFFGWVRPGGGWGPSTRNSTSNNGVFGVTYSYRGDGGDASTRDDGSGTMRLISFTRGGESGSSTSFHMDDNGDWTATIKIPGPTYRYRDLSGALRTTDCRRVQCGVFTIGAHGKASVTNERFAPITFAAPVTPTTRPSSQGGPTPTTEAVPVGPVAPTTPATSAPTTPASTGPASSTTTRPRSSTTIADDRSAPTTPAPSADNSRALSRTAPVHDDGASVGWILAVGVAVAAIAGASFVRLRRSAAQR